MCSTGWVTSLYTQGLTYHVDPFRPQVTVPRLSFAAQLIELFHERIRAHATRRKSLHAQSLEAPSEEEDKEEDEEEEEEEGYYTELIYILESG